jgi:hypothetical protein
VPSIQLPDGKWQHTFSASWLSDFATCPEQARQRYYKISPFDPSDYNALGSALHKAIEVSLQAKIDGQVATIEAARAAALETLERIEAEPNYLPKNEKWPTPEALRTQLDKHIVTFFEEVLPITQPIAVEQEFDLPLYEDTYRSIRLRGFIDYIDAELGVTDWKTSGSPYKTWEKERYEKQPTVYAWAWSELTGQPVDEMRYVVFVHGKAPQTFTVKRNDGHADWLRRQALAAARLVEANLSVWPMVDSGWHCAPKWCAAWATCRGQFLGEKPW